MEILLFGNPAIPSDNLALEVGKALEKEGHTTRHVNNPLELLDIKLDERVIIDVAVGIKEVTLLTNVDRLTLGRLCSLHDLDMAYFMKLMQRLGEIHDVRIIAIPAEMSVQEALPKVKELLHNI